jgi:hypothetical protein
MARHRSRRITWRDRPLYTSRIPFSDDFSAKNILHRRSGSGPAPVKIKEEDKDVLTFKEAVRAYQKQKREMSRKMRAGGKKPLGVNKYKMTKKEKRMIALSALGVVLAPVAAEGIGAAVAYNAAFTEATGVGIPTIVSRAARQFVKEFHGKLE